MKEKYPLSLFLINVLMDIILRRFYLFLLAIVLIIIGIWNKTCLILGITVLLFDIVVSVIGQWNIKREVENSDDPEFAEYKEAILSSDWIHSVKDLVEQAVESGEDFEGEDEEL